MYVVGLFSVGISYKLPLKLGTINMIVCEDIRLVTHDMLGPGNMKDVWIFGWNGGGYVAYQRCKTRRLWWQ